MPFAPSSFLFLDHSTGKMHHVPSTGQSQADARTRHGSVKGRLRGITTKSQELTVHRKKPPEIVTHQHKDPMLFHSLLTLQQVHEREQMD